MIDQVTFRSPPHDKKVVALQVITRVRLLSVGPVSVALQDDIAVAFSIGAFWDLIA